MAELKKYLNERGLREVWDVINGQNSLIVSKIKDIQKRTTVGLYADSTSGWAENESKISEAGALYIYTDAETFNGKVIAKVKIGDGTSSLADLSFIDAPYSAHIADKDIHFTAEERAQWNDEISTFVTAAEESANNAGEAANRAETAKTAAETARDTVVSAKERVLAAEANASRFQTEANKSAQNAKDSEQNAAKSAERAEGAESGAISAANTAQGYVVKAGDSANNAGIAANRALDYLRDAGGQADRATVAANRAETAAQTAQAVADSLPEDYTTAVGKIAENTAEIASVKLTDKELQRRVDALFDMGQGITHQFETDSETAYQKAVPTGGKLMSVKNIGGRSIVFNQIFQPRKEANNGATVTADSDGTITINGTTTASYINFRDVTPEQNKIGKYMFKLLILNNPDNINMKYSFLNRSQSTPVITSGSSAVIYNQTQSEISLGKATGISGFAVGTVFNDVKIKIQIFDLTAMFGSGNEPSSVEEFEKIFPADYYPYNAGEIICAGVESVAVGDTAHPIPEAIKALPGYGWSAGTARNYVDYENKRYVQCVSSVDLGTLAWSYRPEQQRFYAIADSITGKFSESFGIVPNIVVAKYDIVCFNDITTKTDNMKASAVKTANDYITIRNTAYTDATAFKQAMQGVMLYYELETPIVTDISDLIPDDFLRNVEVEAGGSITFRSSNDSYRIPVPNEEEYIVKLSEVGDTT